MLLQMQKGIVLILCLLVSFLSKSQEPSTLETIVQRGHASQVTCAVFSPDGSLMASGSADQSIILWKVKNGKEIRLFNGHTGKIRSLEFNPDGTQLLSAGEDHQVLIFDVRTGKILRQLSLEQDHINQALFSKNGTSVMISTSKDAYYIWKPNKDDSPALSRLRKSYDGFINSTWFHPDSEKEQLLEFVNYQSSRIVSLSNADTINLETEKAFQHSFSPNGKWAAVGSSKLFTDVYDVATGKKRFRLVNDPDQKCDGCNTKVRYSNTGKYLVSATKKTGVHIWSGSSDQRIRNLELSDFRGRIKHLSFSKNDRYLLISNDSRVWVYDLKTGSEVFSKSNKWLFNFEPSISPDEQHILLPGDHHQIEVWNLKTRRIAQVFKGFNNTDQHTSLFDESDWTKQSIVQYLRLKSEFDVSPDGKTVALCKVDSSLQLFDITNGKSKKILKGHSKTVLTCDFNSDGSMLVSGGADRNVVVWNLKTATPRFVLKGHRDLVFDVHYSSDDKLIVSGSWDGTIIIWDAGTGEQLRRIDLGNVAPYCVRFTPGDLYIVAGDLNKKLKLYEVDSGEEFRTMVGHTDVVDEVRFSPDGSKMITASWDGKIKLWDLLTGILISKLELKQGKATAVDWGTLRAGKDSTSIEVIAVGSSDNKLYLYNAQTKKMVEEIEGHNAPVTSVQILKNGKYMISRDAHGNLKITDGDTRERFTYIPLDQDNWLVTSPDGKFDGTKKSLNQINYVFGTEVTPIGSLFKQFYLPGLIENRMHISNSAGKAQSKSNATGLNLNRQYQIQDDIKSAPVVKLTLTDMNKRSVAVASDSVYLARSPQIPLTVSVSGEKSASYTARIYNNGKLIKEEKMGGELVFRGGDERTSKTFTIDLTGGDNELSVTVLNKDQIESSNVGITVNYDGKRALTDLYILSIGINDYLNESYQLKYAVPDANAVIKTVKKGAKGLFENTYEYSIRDKQANKTTIQKAIQEIQQEAGPEDVFLFFYAGHGIYDIEPQNGVDPDFYLVTQDIVNLYGDTKTIKEKAVSATEISEFSKGIAAQKQVFVLDACHSGGALKAFAQRGAGREKALAQLARSTGTFFLTAAQDSQYANESGKLNHGLFSYALLEALTGEVPELVRDEKVTINDLKSYVEERVAELSEEYHGTRQYPTSYSFGQDFPIVLVK